MYSQRTKKLPGRIRMEPAKRTQNSKENVCILLLFKQLFIWQSFPLTVRGWRCSPSCYNYILLFFFSNIFSPFSTPPASHLTSGSYSGACAWTVSFTLRWRFSFAPPSHPRPATNQPWLELLPEWTLVVWVWVVELFFPSFLGVSSSSSSSSPFSAKGVFSSKGKQKKIPHTFVLPPTIWLHVHIYNLW